MRRIVNIMMPCQLRWGTPYSDEVGNGVPYGGEVGNGVPYGGEEGNGVPYGGEVGNGVPYGGEVGNGVPGGMERCALWRWGEELPCSVYYRRRNINCPVVCITDAEIYGPFCWEPRIIIGSLS